MTARARLLLVAAAVGVAVALWVAPGAWARATYGARTTADEPQYLITAISLAEDQSLDVADERAEGRYRAFHEVGLPIQEARQADGSRVSPHDPLLPALLAVPVAAGGWLGAKLALAATAGALAALMTWVAVARLGVSTGVAALTVGAFAAAAPLAIYGTQVYPELPAALVVTIAIAAITGRVRTPAIACAATAVVALPWLSVKYTPVAAALAAVALVRCWRHGERRLAIGFATALVLAAGAFALAHLAWYGGLTPYAAGSHFAAGEATVMGRSPDYLDRTVRLSGLLTDRDFGLVVWQPAYLLTVPALGAVVRARPPGWAALVAPLAAGWTVATFLALTMHGWWWPGRQVVVVLPCAVLAVAWWAGRVAPARALVAVGLLLGAATFAWLVVDVLRGQTTLVVDFERTTNPLVDVLRPVLPDLRRTPAGTAAWHVVWTAALGVLAVVGWRSAAPARPRVRVGELAISNPSP